MSAILAYSIPECNTALKIFDGFYPLSSASTSLLFFHRVRAVYGGHPFVTAVFGVLWICVLGTSILIPVGAHAISVGPSNACLVSEVASYVGAAGIMVTVNDTAVFFAISYRLLSNSHVEHTRGDKVRALFRSPSLPAFSRALFVDGQKYYMCVSLILACFLFSNLSAGSQR